MPSCNLQLCCSVRADLRALAFWVSILVSVVGAAGAAAPAWAGDLALDRPASASSTEDDLAQFAPAGANDGESGTRWSSAYADNQWWEVDLGSDRTIDRVELNWEVAYASRYRIRTRTSGSSTWSTAASVSIDSPGLKVHTFAARSARYVRIRGDARATPWGISLWDARVCDNNTCGATTPPPPPAPTPTRCPDGQYRAQYFVGMALAGVPVVDRCESRVDHNWGTAAPVAGVPADLFSARYDGTIDFAGGEYDFTLGGDDGVRLYLDGTLISNHWLDQSFTTYVTRRTVSAGSHQVRVDFYENGSDARVLLTIANITPTPNPPPPPPPSPDPTTLTLTGPDGGADFWSRWTNGPTDPNYVPRFVWGSYNHTTTNRNLDATAGLNGYTWVADTNFMDDIRADGRFKVIQDEGSRTGVGSETFGWNLGDEVDMFGGVCPGDLISVKNSLPADGRLRFSNYGKGVAKPTPNPWSDLTEARCWINGQDSTSIDLYWFTDPHDGPGNRFGYRYGEVVDRARALDASDGQRQPIWNFVETGWPFTETAAQGGRAILPAELYSAAWHSIIAGARGIMWFQHSFGGPCTGDHHTIRTNCEGTRPMVTRVNNELAQWGNVVNARILPSTNYTVAGGVRASVRFASGQWWVLAGATTGATTATFNLPDCIGTATATRVNGTGSVPVSSGNFSDQFADKNTIHIYRLDGGSTCGP